MRPRRGDHPDRHPAFGGVQAAVRRVTGRARAAPSSRSTSILTTGSMRAAGLATTLSRRYLAVGAEVIAVHVFEPHTVPMFLDGVPDEIAWRDEFLAQHCADLGIRLETRPGPTVLALLDVAASEDVDVIALGWRQNLAPERAVVVREVLQRARRPVALIPQGQPRPQ